MPFNPRTTLYMQLPLGLLDGPDVTLDEIQARGTERLELISLRKKELHYLIEPGLAGRCSRMTADGYIVLLVPLPATPKREMSPAQGRGRQRDLLGMLGRDDDAKAEFVEQLATHLEENSELVAAAGNLMNSAPDLAASVSHIEQQMGVDLTPALHFHRRNGGRLVVGLPGRQVVFDPLSVRVAIAGGARTDGKLLLTRPRGTHADFRAAVEGPVRDLLGGAVKGAKLSDFRVGDLLNWQRIVLEGARHLNYPLSASVRGVFSTLSHRQTHFEIGNIDNWDDLLEQVLNYLLEIRAQRQTGRPS